MWSITKRSDIQRDKLPGETLENVFMFHPFIFGKQGVRANKLANGNFIFLVFEETLNKRNIKTDLKGHHSFTLYYFVYMWQTLPPF